MSVNKVTLLGNLGRDPEYRATQSGDDVCNLSIATSEKWKDKSTGEWKEKTDWHKVVIWGPLAKVARDYLRKGGKVYLEGKLQTRKWTGQDGRDQYTTEVVLNGPRAVLYLIDGTSGGDHDSSSGRSRPSAPAPDFDDEIPF